jgi:cobalt/nickel transport system permease protein
MARFLEKTLLSITDILERSLVNETWSRRRGLLQAVDPRPKIVLLFLAVLLCSLTSEISLLLGLYGAALLLAILSRINPASYTRRVWIFIPFFSGLIALPALFITPGPPLVQLGPLTLTKTGAHTATMLVLRVSTSVSYTLLFVLTTPWNEALRALRRLYISPTAIDLLAVSYRYLLVLVRTLSELLMARKSRSIVPLPHRTEMGFVSRSVGLLFIKSLHLADGVRMAMVSRGYTGEAGLRSVSDNHASKRSKGGLRSGSDNGSTAGSGGGSRQGSENRLPPGSDNVSSTVSGGGPDVTGKGGAADA